MRVRRVALAGAVALGALARCSKARSGDQAAGGDGSSGPPDQEPPVAVNGDSPIQYPPRLYEQKVEGDVVLRLFVDSTGRLAPESSRVAEASGYPALDSAALSGSRRLRFTPARRHGLAIATTFLQPIEFRHPQAGGSVRKGEPDTAARAAPARLPAAAPTPVTAGPPPVRVPRRDSTTLRRDSTAPPVDTTRSVPSTPPQPPPPPAPDSTRARHDSSAGPH